MNMTASKNSIEDQRDRALLERVVARDRDALTQLFLAYQARLFKFVFRLTNSYTAAEELVNDIMLIVWRKAISFQSESKVSTWIFGIAYRQTMRRVTRKQLRTLNDYEPEEAPADDDPTFETEDWIRSGLEMLPAAHQVTVVLVFYLGLSYEETAQVTQCPVNTVKTRMYHARRKLKTILTITALPSSPSKGQQDD